MSIRNYERRADPARATDAAALKYVHDPRADPPRAALFDPDPDRIDEAWIEIDADQLVDARDHR